MDANRELHPPWQSIVPWAVLVSGSLTIVSGFLGLWGEHLQLGLADRLSTVLFDAAGLVILEHPAKAPEASLVYSLARVFGVITAGLGILYIVLGIYRRSAEHVRLIRVRRAGRTRDNLIVICGLGGVGQYLVADLCGEHGDKDQPIVAIEIDPDNPSVASARERGAAVIVGDARDAAVRRRARIGSAESVFVLCGNDSTNLDVVSAIADQLREPSARRERRLQCFTDIASPTLAQAARDNPMFAPRGPHIQLEIFNVIENSARALAKRQFARAHAPAEGEVAYYIIFGFGAIGQAVALHAARLAHFETNTRVRMTIVDGWSDGRGRKVRDGFVDRFPAFCPDFRSFDLAQHVRSADPRKDDWTHRAGRPMHAAWRIDTDTQGRSTPVEYVANAEFLDLQTEVDAPLLIDQLTARVIADQQPRVKPCLVVCFDDDRRNLESALRLSAALARERADLPLFVYLPNEPGLTALLDIATAAGPLDRLIVFGQREISASHEELTKPKVIELANVFQEKYRTGDYAKSVSPAAGAGRHTDPAFLRSDQEAGHHVDVKLAAVDRIRSARTAIATTPQETRHSVFSAHEREILAVMEHNRYMAERLLDGWRYGPRDDVAKRRPSLFAWEYLPDEERKKDFDQIDALSAWLSGRTLTP